MPAKDHRQTNIVKSATDGGGRFYTIRTEPLPTKTCFDVTFKTYCTPQKEHIATIKVPPNYPFAPPMIILKGEFEPQIHFKFLDNESWKPCMSIREMLIEAVHVLSRRELKPRRPQVRLIGKYPANINRPIKEK